MKDKIIMLIIGALIGAVITAGCFLIFKNNSTSNQGGPGGSAPTSMGNFTPGEMPSGGQGGPGSQNSNSTTGSTTTSTSNSTTSSTSTSK